MPSIPRVTRGLTSVAADRRGKDTTIPEGRRGRDRIIVDEWGPYDWKSPKLWPAGRSDALPLTLRMLGPPGRWSVAAIRGASVSPESGGVPGTIIVSPSSDPIVDFDVALDYRGGRVISPRGASIAAGEPYRFVYSRFFVPIDWRVRFFAYTEQSDPVTNPGAFAALVGGAPLKTVTMNRLDYMSGREIEEGVPRDRVAAIAEGAASLPPGDYTLYVISDDGVRVWVDDALEVDSWAPHESKIDRVRLRGGNHRFKVHYYETGGFAELRFDIQRR
jgi:hypothetical protein